MKIFMQLGFAACRTIIPLVCKQWNQLTERSPELWARITLNGDDELDAFSTLQRSGQTGGIKLTAERRSLVINPPPVICWFRRHPGAASCALSTGHWDPIFRPDDCTISLRMGQGDLNAILMARQNTLEHLQVSDSRSATKQRTAYRLSRGLIKRQK